MGDAPGLGTLGTVGDHVLGNERDDAKAAPNFGIEAELRLKLQQPSNERASFNEVMSRIIFLIRLLKVDAVVCWEPWAHDEENPDPYSIARATGAACWMAGRKHDCARRGFLLGRSRDHEVWRGVCRSVPLH